MAYIPSECTLQEYEEQIYSGSNNHRLYIKYGDTIIGDEANEYASPFASSLKWTRRLLDNGSKTFNLDCFVSQEIELVLNDYVIQDITQEIDIKIGTYIEKLNKWVYIPLGKYLVQDNPTTNENRTTYKLKDKSKLFDFKYNAEPLITSKGGKATLLEILDDICSQANVNYVGSRTFSGYNEQIGIYDNTINARIYVSYIAEQSGSIATIDRNGNLTFIKIKQSELTTREVSEDIVEGFTDGDNFIISKVVYESGIIKYEKGDDNNDTLYINSANPYVSNQTQVDNIYNIVNGLNINSFAISKIYGNPTFDPWDLIVLNYEGKTYKTFAQYIFTFNGVFTSKYETTIEHSAKKQNVSVNSEATFRKYAKTTIDNIEAKVNIATGKVEQIEKEVTTIKETSGNNSLYIEDALESRVQEYGIDGKSEQDGTPTPDTPVEIKSVDGIRNLWKLPETKTLNGITFTKNSDGTFNITGTATANTSFLSWLDLSLIENNKLYTLSSNYAVTGLEYRFEEYNNTTWVKQYTKIGNSTTSKSSSVTISKSTGNKVRLCIYVFSGTTLNLQNVEIQLQKGNQTTFVPYGSWLKVQTTGKNLFDKNKLSVGYLNADGTINSGDGNYRVSDFISVKPNTIYYKGITQTSRAKFYNKNKQPLNTTTYQDIPNGASATQFTTPNDAYYLRVTIRSNTTDTNIDNLQIEQNDQATEYEPYQSNQYNINLLKENLVIDNIKGYINVNSSTFALDNASETFIFNVEQGKTYIRTCQKTLDRSYIGQALTENIIQGTPLSNVKTLNGGNTFTSDFTGICVWYVNSSKNDEIKETFKVYEGTDPTPYYELCSTKDGSVTDTINIDDLGNVTLTKRIGTYIANVNDGWAKHSSRNIYYITDTNLNILEPIDNTYRVKALSNYLTPIPYYIDGTTKDIIGNENGIAIDVSTHRLYLGAKSVSSITDLTTFKTWLSTHNTQVDYVLAEPYTIELGQVDISLFENINHINLLEDIETDTRLKYLINTTLNGTYATKGELELTNEQFQTTITNEFNSLERQMTSITQTGGAIDLAIQSSKDYTDSKNESLDNRITNSENNYNDLNNKYNTLNGKITDMNFSFKTDGLTIGTSGSKINSKLDNKGLKIYNASTLIAIFNQNGSGLKKLIVEKSIQIQNLLIQKRTMNTPKANNMDVISFFFNTQETTIEKIEELDN